MHKLDDKTLFFSKRARERILQSDWFLARSRFSYFWPRSQQRLREFFFREFFSFESLEKINKLFTGLGSVRIHSLLLAM